MCRPSLFTALLVLGLLALVSVARPAYAQTAQAAQKPVLITLHRFDNTHGAFPQEAMTLSTDGNFYGVTHNGGPFFHGSASLGTVFKMTPQGQYTSLFAFNGINGFLPHGPLTLAPGGFLYGVTEVGGPDYGTNGSLGSGTVFCIAPDGVVSSLYHFHKYGDDNRDGAFPHAAPLRASDGTLYGTTISGGRHNRGIIYALSPKGALTVLHDFVGAEGAHPYGGLTRAQNGTLYGTTTSGGRYNNGDIFSLTTDGHLRVLHSFIKADGYNVYSPLVFDQGGALLGNAINFGPLNGGTIFRITPQGAFSVMHAFGSDGHESTPYAGLVQGSNGVMYGTLANATPYSENSAKQGAIFSLSGDGQVTTLYKFHTDFDGSSPFGGVVFSPDGTLYGTTQTGGSKGYGTIFKLTLPQ